VQTGWAFSQIECLSVSFLAGWGTYSPVLRVFNLDSIKSKRVLVLEIIALIDFLAALLSTDGVLRHSFKNQVNKLDSHRWSKILDKSTFNIVKIFLVENSKALIEESFAWSKHLRLLDTDQRHEETGEHGRSERTVAQESKLVSEHLTFRITCLKFIKIPSAALEWADENSVVSLTEIEDPSKCVDTDAPVMVFDESLAHCTTHTRSFHHISGVGTWTGSHEYVSLNNKACEDTFTKLGEYSPLVAELKVSLSAHCQECSNDHWDGHVPFAASVSWLKWCFECQDDV